MEKARGIIANKEYEAALQRIYELCTLPGWAGSQEQIEFLANKMPEFVVYKIFI